MKYYKNMLYSLTKIMPKHGVRLSTNICINIFFCVGVMYSGEYDVCNVTLSVYPHRASFKNMPGQACLPSCPVPGWAGYTLRVTLQTLYSCRPSEILASNILLLCQNFSRFS